LENPAPYVSASQWVILDRKKGEVLFGKCETETRQIASLTKIMTAYCVLNLVGNNGPTDFSSPFCDMNSQVKILKPVS
jgi:serine-type D-Ala-D-Ala carboxypeptidase (penicillin-binding protein 5/6)